MIYNNLKIILLVLHGISGTDKTELTKLIANKLRKHHNLSSMIGEQKLNLIDILNKSTIRVLCYSFSLQPGTPRFFTMNNIDDLVKCSCIISKEILCRITFIKKNKPIFNINLNVTSNTTTNINIHDKSKK